MEVSFFHYSNGSVHKEFHSLKGKMHGLYKSYWYHKEKGNSIHIFANFSHGSRDKVYQSFWYEGGRSCILNYKTGTLHGISIKFHKEYDSDSNL